MSERNLDYEKIIVSLIAHFVESEGTDYLGSKDESVGKRIPSLSEDEAQELMRIRDLARKQVGWAGYV